MHNSRELQQRYAAFLDTQAAGDPAHDREHIRRVVNNAQRLAAAEQADLLVVEAAAWLHDCVIVPKDSPLRAQASQMAAAAARQFLASIDFPAERIEAVAHAIEAHSFSAGIAPRTLEAQIVQDADRLDALGAVGIARTLMLGAVMGRQFYDPQEPFPTQRPPDDMTSSIDHFYTKLLHLADRMHTAAGKAEATRRTAFLRAFLDQLASEIPEGGRGIN